jgi:WD40 repeat protein
MFRSLLSFSLCLACLISVAAPGRALTDATAKDKPRPRPQPVHLRKVLELPSEAREIGPVAVSRDNNLVAYATDRPKHSSLFRRFSLSEKSFETETNIKIWNRQTGRIETTLQDPLGHDFGSMFFSADGRSLGVVRGFNDRFFKLWDLASGRVVATIQQEGGGWETSRFQVSPNGKYLAMASREGTARLWSLPTCDVKVTMNEYVAKEGSAFQKWLFSEKYQKPYLWVSFHFSHDSALLAKIADTKNAEVWDTATGRLLYTLDGSDRFLDFSTDSSDFFSPDGRIVATTYGQREESSGRLKANGVKLWLAKDGSFLKEFEHASAPVRFSPDGTRLATGLVHWEHDGTKQIIAEIWDVETGKLLTRLIDPEDSLDEMFWSPDGRSIGTASGGTYTLTVRDADTGQARFRLRLVRHHGFDFVSDYISDQDALFFSPDSRFLIARNNKFFRIIDAKTGAVLEKIEGLNYRTFLSNGELLTVSADNQAIVVWKIVD